jgi:hypothetical protein
MGAGIPEMERDAMTPRLRYFARGASMVFALAAVLTLAGCYYPPGTYVATAPASVDRSFYAAADAMRDQGVTIGVQDRAGGTIIGQLGGATVTATVLQQPDGSVQVRFNATNASDPTLLQRVSQSYDYRMGR